MTQLSVRRAFHTSLPALIGRTVSVLVALAVMPPDRLMAQRHYANTHASGPVRVEDAIPEGRGEFEIRLPGFRLDDPDVGPRRWRFDPVFSYGVSSRTSLEVGGSFAWLGSLSRPNGGLTGVDFEVLHLLTPERGGVPAVTVALDAFVPAGPLRNGGLWTQARTMATRTRGHSRAHFNAAVGTYRVEIIDPGASCRASSLLIKLGLTCDGSIPVLPGGPCANMGSPTGRFSAVIPTHCARADAAFAADTTIVSTQVSQPRSGVRWFSGLAVDRDITSWSTLLIMDVHASRLIGLQTAADWGADIGARRQVGTHAVFEMAIGRRVAGARPGWSATGGISWSAP
jgi:hypothetical protein